MDIRDLTHPTDYKLLSSIFNCVYSLHVVLLPLPTTQRQVSGLDERLGVGVSLLESVIYISSFIVFISKWDTSARVRVHMFEVLIKYDSLLNKIQQWGVLFFRHSSGSTDLNSCTTRPLRFGGGSQGQG